MHWFESRNWTYWQCSWCCCRSGDYVHTSVWHQRRCAVFLKWIIKWFCLESLNICNTSIRRCSCRWTSSQLSPEGGSPHLTLEPELSGHSSTALDYCFVQLKYKIYEYFFFQNFFLHLEKHRLTPDIKHWRVALGKVPTLTKSWIIKQSICVSPCRDRREFYCTFTS